MTLTAHNITENSQPPLIAILMCTYNGMPYLTKQLDSIVHQTHKNWQLIVSDDGSSDETLAMLQSYKRVLGSKITILRGPQQGFAKNFMSLIKNNEIQADYYAFSDQDDIWHPDKLQHALITLRRCEAYSTPVVYCSRCRLINERGKYVGMTPIFRRKPSFQNALVQSIAGANTMVFNSEAKRILETTPTESTIIAHDWLMYLLITAARGKIIYDTEAKIDYRQHSRNLIGSNSGWLNRIRRLKGVMRGRFKTWVDANLAILEICSLPIDEADIESVEFLKNTRNRRISQRIAALYNSKTYRQTSLGQISLWTAVIMKKL